MRAADRVEWAVLLGLPVAAVMYVALLAVAQWPEYWTWIAPEQTPMTWLESVLLVLCAVVSLLLAAARVLRDRPGALPWLVLAAGFGFLALDERFALHERVRDGYLAPRGVAPPFLPWVAPGDFLLLGYAVLGLAILPFVLRAFKGDSRARRLVFAGAAFAVLAVISDSFNVHTMSLTTEIRQQTSEEVVELASCVCFLLAMWLRLVPVLGDHPGVDAPIVHAGEPAPRGGPPAQSEAESAARPPEKQAEPG